jgi:hypothetical protein
MRSLTNWGAGMSAYQDGQQYDVIVRPEEILNAIAASRDHGTVIGIYSPELGDTMYITGIDELVVDGENTVVVLKKYDMSGHIFERHTLMLHEIVSVFPFTSPLKNPFLDKVEKDNDWYVIINSEDNPARLHKNIS